MATTNLMCAGSLGSRFGGDHKSGQGKNSVTTAATLNAYRNHPMVAPWLRKPGYSEFYVYGQVYEWVCPFVQNRAASGISFKAVRTEARDQRRRWEQLVLYPCLRDRTQPSSGRCEYPISGSGGLVGVIESEVEVGMLALVLTEQGREMCAQDGGGRGETQAGIFLRAQSPTRPPPNAFSKNTRSILP